VSRKEIASVILTPSERGWRFRVHFTDGTKIESEKSYFTRGDALCALERALLAANSASEETVVQSAQKRSAS